MIDDLHPHPPRPAPRLTDRRPGEPGESKPTPTVRGQSGLSPDRSATPGRHPNHLRVPAEDSTVHEPGQYDGPPIAGDGGGQLRCESCRRPLSETDAVPIAWGDEVLFHLCGACSRRLRWRAMVILRVVVAP